MNEIHPIRTAILSDIGKERNCNEDYAGVSEDKHTLVVCDGVGGHEAGDVASKIAVETILSRNGLLPEGLTLPDESRRLIASVRLANRRIHRDGQSTLGTGGMGTTAVAITANRDVLTIAHVGDSRCYRLREGNLEKLTEDHSWVNELLQDGEITEEQAKDFPKKNVITRALGSRKTVKIDVRVDSVMKNDLYLLCSDGLWGVVDDDVIKRILITERKDLKIAVKKLIETANDNGGTDNITVGIMEIADVDEEVKPRDPTVLTVPEESRDELQKEDTLLKKLYPQKAAGLKRLVSLITGGDGS
jgi:protein phosphatase